MRALIILLLSGLCAFGQAFTFQDAAFVNAALGQAPASTWTPTDLSTALKVWLKNESLTGDDGTAVGGWADSSGNEYFFTNALTASWPYVTNTTTFGTGIKSLYFNAADTDRMTNVNGGIFRNIASCSLVVVLQPVDQASSRAMFNASVAGSANQRFQITILNTDDSWYISGRKADADSNEITTSSTPLTPLPIIFQADADYADTAGYAWTNQVAAITDTAIWTGTGNTADTDSSYITLMHSGTGSAMTAWVAEVLVVVPKLSDANRTNVWNYLDAKFDF